MREQQQQQHRQIELPPPLSNQINLPQNTPNNSFATTPSAYQINLPLPQNQAGDFMQRAQQHQQQFLQQRQQQIDQRLLLQQQPPPYQITLPQPLPNQVDLPPLIVQQQQQIQQQIQQQQQIQIQQPPPHQITLPQPPPNSIAITPPVNQVGLQNVEQLMNESDEKGKTSDEMKEFVRNLRLRKQRMKELNLSFYLTKADALEFNRITRNDYLREHPEAAEREKEIIKERKEKEDRMLIDAFLNDFEETKKSTKTGKTYRLPSFSDWVDTGKQDVNEWVGFWDTDGEDDDSLDILLKWAENLQNNYKRIDKSKPAALTRGGTNYRVDDDDDY
jgi:hypothetical protein